MSYIEEFGGGRGGGGRGGGGRGGGGRGGGGRGGHWRGGGGRGNWGWPRNYYYGGGIGFPYAGWGYPYAWDQPYYNLVVEPSCELVYQNTVCRPDKPFKVGIDTNGTGVVDTWQCCSKRI